VSYKLLSAILNCTLWDDHVATITSKAEKGSGFFGTCRGFSRRPIIIRGPSDLFWNMLIRLGSRASQKDEQTKALEDVQRRTCSPGYQ